MIRIVGLGPADLDRVPDAIRSILLDPSANVICRTERHPAAKSLSQEREVTFCDDIYQAGTAFGDVYEAIRDRVLAAAESNDVVYAVPGSPLIGEFAVRLIMASSADVEVIPGESFVDAVLLEVGYDPLDRGLQILNGHELPDPLVIDKPTIIAHLSSEAILADVAAQLDRVLPEDAAVTVLADLGSPSQRISSSVPEAIERDLAGDLTSIFVDAQPGGLIGAIRTMRHLREECPWDQEQTHQTLVKNLVEEVYELIESIDRLPEDQTDWVAYAEVEDELGDVLLQVLFHSAIARGHGAFDIDDVAETMRQKLVRRHPHVFGDVVASSAAEVKANWDQIKEEERGMASDTSALAGVPQSMPAIHRASKVQNRAAKDGFDWAEATDVLPKVSEEIEELAEAIETDGDVAAEFGDLLFSVVNLSRHLAVDPELALRTATRRFEERYRVMEQDGPLAGLTLEELNQRWEKAKRG